ncbi:MAG: type 4 prepilin-like proteins leader peptide-processing enzyme [Candidatus Dojkabacteria bacterium]|nr:MAG: type 4 prepilin-like proteins leader peptide-processing enzyme [Candidatus Dojkabacteria bacterium]
MTLLDIFFYSFVFIFGSIMGSFLNVLIIRIHLDMPWWIGRSHCMSCNKTLSPIELIPILSFILQKGMCRHCGSKISIQYPIVELLCGIVAVFSVLLFGYSVYALLIFFILWFILGDFISDLLYMELPELFNFVLMILGVIYLVFSGSFDFVNMLIGVVFGFSFFAIQYLLTKGKGIGEGDLRLGVIIGIYFGWPHALYSIMFSYMLATVVLLPLLITRKLSTKTAVPLGVFLLPVLAFGIVFPHELKDIFDPISVMFEELLYLLTF